MTLDERATPLMRLGFTTRQARFLATVALHGGYCLRRQYETFTGQAHGKNSYEFFERLVAARLASRHTFRSDRGSVYHLRNQRLYRLVGDLENRNRRPVELSRIAQKVMLLDYVMSQTTVEWLATETDKVSFFTETLGVDRGTLPGRSYFARDGGTAETTRHFVEKLPIGIRRDSAAVQFVYLLNDSTTSGFEHFLSAYAPLLTAISGWVLTLVHPPHISASDACAAAFDHWSAAPAAKPADAIDEEMLWYFHTRRLVERKEWRSVSMPDLARYRELRRRHATPRVERLYAEWSADGESLAIAPLPAAIGELVIHALPQRYEQFGSLPGVC